MTHADAKDYRAKHPPGAEADLHIASALKPKISNGGISCAAAHTIAADLQVPPQQVGQSIDLLNLRIKKCQLGLFGYHPQKRIVEPAQNVSAQLAEALREGVENGRIACLTVWQIADRFKIPRLQAAAACEALKLKVAPCQLGAF